MIYIIVNLNLVYLGKLIKSNLNIYFASCESSYLRWQYQSRAHISSQRPSNIYLIWLREVLEISNPSPSIFKIKPIFFPFKFQFNQNPPSLLIEINSGEVWTMLLAASRKARRFTIFIIFCFPFDQQLLLFVIDYLLLTFTILHAPLSRKKNIESLNFFSN